MTQEKILMLWIGASLLLSACRGRNEPLITCSAVKSISVPESNVAKGILAGSFSSGWGGVLDLIEQPDSPNTSPRRRCTVRMDYIPATGGVSVSPHRFAFWTAEHCLDWTSALSAELNIFDSSTLKYIRFRVDLDELTRFQQGSEIFSQTMPEELAEYRSGGTRPAKGIIERGIPACKTDTSALQQGNSSLGVVCSSVLDLARLEGTVHPSEQNRADVADILERIRTAIVEKEAEQIAKVDAMKGHLLQIQYDYFMSFLVNWRPKVSLISKWRGYEGFADLIEKVRQCGDTASTGYCSPNIRNFFADALNEYDTLAQAGVSYPDFLRSEVNRTTLPRDAQTLNWLLYYQKNLRQALPLSDQISFDSNFLRSVSGFSPELVGRTLGDAGPLLYLSIPVTTMINTSVKPLADHFTFNEKTLLFSYDTKIEFGENFLLQPGDSGTMLMVGNQPIGVVSTVNGEATSGGTSVLPLPEYIEEESEPSNSASPVSESNNSIQPACRS